MWKGPVKIKLIADYVFPFKPSIFTTEAPKVDSKGYFTFRRDIEDDNYEMTYHFFKILNLKEEMPFSDIEKFLHMKKFGILADIKVRPEYTYELSKALKEYGIETNLVHPEQYCKIEIE